MGDSSLASITVQAASADVMNQAQNELQMILDARHGVDAGLSVIGKIALQLDHLARESFAAGVKVAAHRAGDALVAAGVAVDR